MTMRRIVLASCLLSALCFATLAHADDAAIAEAQARFNEGLALADNGKYEEARLKFLQAVAVLKAPAVLFNLASTEQKTGHEVEAIEHYRAFLTSSINDTRITDAMRDRATQNIHEMLKRVSQISIDAPEGAKISVDGKSLEHPAKEPVAVVPGKHTVEAAFEGKVKAVTVEARNGEVSTAKLDFESGSNLNTYEAPAGSYGHRTTAGWVVPITLGVLGVGGVVMGGVLTSASQDSRDEAASLRVASPGICVQPTSPACAAYDDKRGTAESQSALAWAGYVAGGTLLAASIASFIFWPKASASTATSRGTLLTPVLGPQMAGGSLQTTF
jgi:hypothetical protein